jgi:hypothetical protein
MPIVKISTKVLQVLRNDLPFGSAAVLRERILRRHKKDFSVVFINLVLNPTKPQYSVLIIEEAILYRNELRAAAKAIENKILN